MVCCSGIYRVDYQLLVCSRFGLWVRDPEPKSNKKQRWTAHLEKPKLWFTGDLQRRKKLVIEE